MSKQIVLACGDTVRIPLGDIHYFQGGLKELTEECFEKLRKEILTDFAFSPHVWKNDDGKWMLVDGHQRIRVVTHLVEQEGFVCPPIPCVPVAAGSYKEARRRVLQATSQYGKITNDGLYEFINDANAIFDMNDLEVSFQFPDIDLYQFKLNFFEQTIPPDETDKSNQAGTDFLNIPFEFESRLKAQLIRRQEILSEKMKGSSDNDLRLISWEITLQTLENESDESISSGR